MTGSPRRIRASVVICTLNRADELRETLRAVEQLTVPFEWELLVVDNGLCDRTKRVVHEARQKLDTRVRLEYERTPGLSAARNLGLRLADGEIVVFLDDDAHPDPGWLEAFSNAFNSSGVGSAGGPIEPRFEGTRPSWLDEWCLACLSAWNLGPSEVDLRYIELPRGANVAYHREIFQLVGEFDQRLGRSGKSLRSCEELELGLRIERCGFRTRFVPRAKVQHQIDASRLSPRWMIRRFAAQGFSEAIVDWKHLGWSGIRESWRRSGGDLDSARRERGSEDSLRFRCVRAQWSAYRRGALYSIWRVERWAPPESRRRLP